MLPNLDLLHLNCLKLPSVPNAAIYDVAFLFSSAFYKVQEPAGEVDNGASCQKLPRKSCGALLTTFPKT